MYVQIFLKENSRFKIDPQVQKLMIDLLLGRIDPLYAGPNDYKEFYQKYRKNIDGHPFVINKEEELKNLKTKRDLVKSFTKNRNATPDKKRYSKNKKSHAG